MSDGHVDLPRDRRGRVHRLAHLPQAARGGAPGGRRRRGQRLLRSELEGGAPRPPRAAAGVLVRAARPRRPRRGERAVRAGAPRRGREPRGAGGRPLLDREPARVRRLEPRRVRQRARGLPPQRLRAPRLRVVELRVRREHAAAVLGARQHRPPAQPVRGDEEGERADGPHVLAPLRAADVGPAVLHGVRAVGAARHGDVPVREGDARGARDRRVQPRQDAARFHVHRRHRRGGRAHPARARAAERRVARRRPRSGHEPRALPRLQHRQQRARRADAPHRGARARARREREEELLADAGRRRAGDVRRHRRARRRGRLHAADVDRGRRRAVRRVVPRLLPRVRNM